MTSWIEKIKGIEQERKVIENGGGTKAIKKQHQLGKLTARERIAKLLDPGTFMEFEPWDEPTKTGFDIDKETTPADAVVAGSGEINGRSVYLYAQDFTTAGGTLATVHAAKITQVMERALKLRIPFISMIDSSGVRLEDALTGRRFYSPSSIMYTQTLLSGVVPQISLVMGPCIGEMACSAALADFTFLVEGSSYMHLISPSSAADSEQLKDVKLHSRLSGCCDLVAKNDEDCLDKCKQLLSFLPANNQEKPPAMANDDDPQRRIEEILDIVPADTLKPYDMHKVIHLLVDNGHFFELKPEFAKCMIIGLARLDGQVVGIVANNPMFLAGAIDFNASDKEARFVRFCDAFNIPLIYLADTPAFMPGIDQEQGGILRHGAKVVHANSEATVPKLVLYGRKCYGGGILAMCQRQLGHDIGLSWPGTEHAAMGGAKGATTIIYRKEIESAEDPEEVKTRRAKEIEPLIRKMFRQSYQLEEIIEPQASRVELIKALRLTSGKVDERPWKKHGNITL